MSSKPLSAGAMPELSESARAFGSNVGEAWKALQGLNLPLPAVTQVQADYIKEAADLWNLSLQRLQNPSAAHDAAKPQIGDRRFHALLVQGEAEIVVGPHEDRVATVDPASSGRHKLVDAHAEGVGAGLDDLAVATRNQRVLVEDVHEFSDLRSVGGSRLADPVAFSSPPPR